MPIGRPDFWYGQVLLFEEEPTDTRTDAGPTSNWAYHHRNDALPTAHPLFNAGAVAAMGTKADNNPLHHDKYAGEDVDAKILTHKNIADAHHAKYTNAEAVTAMGAKANNNPLNHDRTVSSDIDHGSIVGLGDDDHTQYLHTSIIRNMGVMLKFLNNDTPFMFVESGQDTLATYIQPSSNWALRHRNSSTGVTLLNLDMAGNLTIPGTITAEGGGIGGFIDRGDPADWDKKYADFTRDDTWRDCDLSAIVPSTAKAIVLRLRLKSATPGAAASFRKKGNTGTVNVFGTDVQVANIYNNVIGIVPIGSDGIIRYNASSALSDLMISAMGWFL